MVRATILNEATTLRNDLITRNPDGCRLDRFTFERLIIVGYGKSKEAAERVIKTGEGAGYWTRHHDWATKKGWVDVHAVVQGLPAIL